MITQIAQGTPGPLAEFRRFICGMAIIMAVAALVALRGLKRGVQAEPEAARTGLIDRAAGEDPDTDLDTAWR